MIATYTMTKFDDINRATLAELSIAAAELWEQLEELPSGEEQAQDLEKLLQIQDATAEKIDAIAYVADQLKIDLQTWQTRLEKVVELHYSVINKRKRQLEGLKAYLLRLNELGLLENKVMGVERRIDFQNSPPSVELLVEPEELPQEYQSIKVTPKSKEILEAYNRGEDVEAIAKVNQSKHVRFKTIGRK
ncbi:siphovirus Gp157 family protein [Merismopedia glauca]|uniref:siphovirus Gp157 family protein n=1 Tax=Merismopedia glauca TaxID=292586 RepID=UPI001C62EA68|nr:siphovirus Gp157 family protein [Merismopedia glauca]